MGQRGAAVRLQQELAWQHFENRKNKIGVFFSRRGGGGGRRSSVADAGADQVEKMRKCVPDF